MNEAQILERLAAEDTFRADTQLPSTAWSPEVAFAEVERLMETIPEHTSAPRPAGSRRNLAFRAAAGAFVVVLLIGVTLALIVRNGEETQPVATTQPVVTTTPPTTSTTTLAPTPIDEAALGYFESVVAELNAGDAVAAAAGTMTAETFIGPINEFDDRLLVASWFELWVLLESNVAIDECRTGSSGTTRCVLSHTSVFQPFYPDSERVVFEFSVNDDGTVRFMRVQVDETSPAHLVWLEFGDWLWNASQPDYNDVFFVLDPEAAADALRRRVPTWLLQTGRFDRDPVEESALANGVSASAFELISDFHSALSTGDVAAAESVFAPGGQYTSTENADVTSAGVYGEELVGSEGLTEYFEFWYRLLATEWALVDCSGDATTVTCNTESRGLMTLFLPNGVARGVVTYTIGPDGIETVLDRTVRTGGSCGPNACAENGFDLRGFWRSWMPETAPEVELLWPEGNGDPVNGLDEQFAAAIWEYYPQFLMENGIDVPQEYLER